MKTKTTFFVLLFISFSICSFSQFSFSVSPGLSWTGAQVGYQANSKVVPYLGLQYLSANISFNTTDEYYDGLQVVSYDEQGDINARIIIPTLGVKYFILEKNSLKGYLNLNLSKPLIMGSAENDGDTIEEYEDVIDGVSLLGFEFGFGAEHYFNENFSVGGEFGIRSIGANVSGSYTNTFNNNNGNLISTTDSYEYNGRISPTYSRIVLNFYF